MWGDARVDYGTVGGESWALLQAVGVDNNVGLVTRAAISACEKVDLFVSDVRDDSLVLAHWV